MTMPDPKLHMMCGKIAAGKSTLAAQLASAPGHVLISEDAWLAALYPDAITTAQDYLRCADRIRSILEPHVAQLLRAGLGVVLDVPANTVESRVWLRRLVRDTQVSHQMHVLTPPDAVCLARLQARNKTSDHPFAATEAQFRAFARHFVEPGPDEKFTILRHTP